MIINNDFSKRIRKDVNIREHAQMVRKIVKQQQQEQKQIDDKNKVIVKDSKGIRRVERNSKENFDIEI